MSGKFRHWLSGFWYGPGSPELRAAMQKAAREEKERRAANRAAGVGLDGMPFGARIKMEARDFASGLWQEMRPDFRIGRRVRDGLGRWPQAVQRGPYSYVIKAAHWTPRRAKWAAWFAVAFAGIVFLATFGQAQRPDGAAFVYGVAVGTLCGLLSWPLFWWFLRERLVLRIEDGGIEWRGRLFKRFRVAPAEPYLVEVLPQHRKAPEESREHAETLRSGKVRKTPRPVYQIASEVIIHTGPGWVNWLPVAEIADDESRQKAHALVSAVKLVVERCRVEAASPAPPESPVFVAAEDVTGKRGAGEQVRRPAAERYE